jgi:hypothetical protein
MRRLMCSSKFAWYLEPFDSGLRGYKISTLGALFCTAMAARYNISPDRMMSCFHDVFYMATGVHIPGDLLRSARTVDAVAREGDVYLQAALRDRMASAAGIGACVATDDSPIEGVGEVKAMLVYFQEPSTGRCFCRTLSMAAVPSKMALQGAQISYSRLKELADTTKIGSAIADNASAAQAHNDVLLGMIDDAQLVPQATGEAGM